MSTMTKAFIPLVCLLAVAVTAAAQPADTDVPVTQPGQGQTVDPVPLDAPPGATDFSGNGSYTVTSSGGNSRQLDITGSNNGKVTSFNLDGKPYTWDADRKSYQCTTQPPTFHSFEFRKNTNGGYNYKKRATAGNVLETGTATPNF